MNEQKVFATIYVLLYGDYYDLHERLLDSLYKAVAHTVREEPLRFRFWGNQIGRRTEKLFARDYRGVVSGYPRDENVPKYRAMKEMFDDDERAGSSEWTIWFDDDSYINRGDWWRKTVAHVKAHPRICYMGQPWFVHHFPGQWQFIEKAKWYKGLPTEQCPTRTKGKTKPGITFAQGAYWWLRTDVRKQIDWPDPRLNHNGGDTLLGEAIRQQGLPLEKFHYGVDINKAKRRGFREKPAGSDRDICR